MDDAQEWEPVEEVKPVTLEELLDYIENTEDGLQVHQDIPVKELLRRMGR